MMGRIFSIRKLSGWTVALAVGLCLAIPVTSAFSLGAESGQSSVREQMMDIASARLAASGQHDSAANASKAQPVERSVEDTSASQRMDADQTDKDTTFAALTSDANVLTKANVSMNTEAKIYDGRPAELNLVVTDNAGKRLTLGRDFTFEADDRSRADDIRDPGDLVDAGTFDIYIYGKGNYTGKVVLEYQIKMRPLSLDDFTIKTEVPFTGSKVNLHDLVTPTDAWVPKDGDYFLKPYGNDDMQRVGTHKAMIVGQSSGEYEGVKAMNNCSTVPELVFEFTITPGCLFADKPVPTVYNGRVQAPRIVVHNGAGVELMEGTDYVIATYMAPDGTPCSYTGIVNAGEYEAQIVGEGNYKGSSCEVKFTIEQATFTVDEIPQQPFTTPFTPPGLTVRNAQRPDLMLAVSAPAAPGDCTVQYFQEDGKTSIEADEMWRLGTYVVRVSGTGANYRADCVVAKTFSVVNANFRVEPVAEATYSGNVQLPTLKMTRMDKSEADSSKFSVSYAKNGKPIEPTDLCDAGEYLITVKANDAQSGGLDAFHGQIVVPYRIAPAQLSVGAIPARTYTTGVLEPTLTVTGVQDRRLAAGVDYDVTYRHNGTGISKDSLVVPGSYEAVVCGKGNYQGEQVAQYTIIPGEFSAQVVGSIEFNGGLPTVKLQAQSGGVALHEDYVAHGWLNDDGSHITQAETIHAGHARVLVEPTKDIAPYFAADANKVVLDVEVKSAIPQFKELDDTIYDGRAHNPVDCLTNSLGETIKPDSYRIECYKATTKSVRAGSDTATAQDSPSPVDMIDVGRYQVKAVPLKESDFANQPVSFAQIVQGTWTVRDIPSLAYTGKPVVPRIEVVYEGALLQPNLFKVDFTEGSQEQQPVKPEQLIEPGSYIAYISMVDTDNFKDMTDVKHFTIFKKSDELEKGPSAEELFGGKDKDKDDDPYQFKDKKIGLTDVEAPEDDGPLADTDGAPPAYKDADGGFWDMNGQAGGSGEGGAGGSADGGIPAMLAQAISSVPPWILGLGMVGAFSVVSCGTVFGFYRRSQRLARDLMGQ